MSGGNLTEGYIVSVAVPRPLEGLFTYRVPEGLLSHIHVGGWVKVPFGRSLTYAFVVEPPRPVSEVPHGLSLDSLKSVIEASRSNSAAIPKDVFALCKWAHEYYFSPLGEVLHCAAPPAVLGLKSKRKEARPVTPTFQAPEIHLLSPDQLQALDRLESFRKSDGPKVALLHGVTGSGKTELYLELARRTLAEGKGVLLLVPEIALTSQLHQRFEGGLGVSVALWHSALADGKRRDLSAALRKGELRVVVGARSAVFAPVLNLGFIVIDEEHDTTYKQEDRVRYHARDLAIVRAKISRAFVVLGSATPSLETRERVLKKDYGVARLDHRIKAGGLPKIEIVDLCLEPRIPNTQAPLASRTVDAIRETLGAGDQAIIFLNRRGFAAFLVCEDCGEVRGCPNCSISLTVYRKNARLRCHVCGYQEIPPDICQKCLGTKLKAVGAGTESLETELPQWVPGMKMLRLDRDQVTSASRLEKILEDFRQGRANVLLGTQMLVKGHDFPNVTLVVVVLADALFRWPDFRAPERAYQILRQVSGRAGRGHRAGRVLIQAFDKNHSVLQALQGTLSEEKFLENERQLRQALGYPPFGRLVKIRFENRNAQEAKNRSMSVSHLLSPWIETRQIEVLGPSEAFLERANGTYRWDLLIKAPRVEPLHKSLVAVKNHCARQKWQCLIDVDPHSSV